MPLQRALVEALSSEPFCTLLQGIAEIPLGRRALNWLSRPYSVYPTFDEAWSAARKVSPFSHEHPGVVELQLKHSRTLRASDYAVLYWLSHIEATVLKVFDFGGNVGNLFYSYLPYCPGSVEWTVFDLPATVAQGRELAKNRNAEGLAFADSVQEFSREQILLVSGAFHYWQEDVEAFLRQFPQTPQHVLINRSPFAETQASYVTVQRTDFCAMPCRVWNAEEVISAFAQQGYRLVDRWRALELALRLPLFPELSVPSYSGFYFSRPDRT